MSVGNVSAVLALLLFGFHPERCGLILYIPDLAAERMLCQPFPESPASADQLVGAVGRLFEAFEEDEVAFTVRGEVGDAAVEEFAGSCRGLVECLDDGSVPGAAEVAKQALEFVVGEEVFSGYRALFGAALDFEELHLLRVFVAVVLDLVEPFDRAPELLLAGFGVVAAVDSCDGCLEFVLESAPYSEVVRGELLEHGLPGVEQPDLLWLSGSLRGHRVDEVFDCGLVLRADGFVFEILKASLNVVVFRG